MAESIYQNIVRRVEPGAPESVHMCSYPVADPALIDQALMEEMDFVLKVVTVGRSARNSSGIKTASPFPACWSAEAECPPLCSGRSS